MWQNYTESLESIGSKGIPYNWDCDNWLMKRRKKKLNKKEKGNTREIQSESKKDRNPEERRKRKDRKSCDRGSYHVKLLVPTSD